MKLAVCDLDGTLLEKNEKTLKKNIIKQIENLRKKGFLFACASGRTYGELKRIFSSMDIFYISSDGALITLGDKAIFENCFNNEDIKYFFKSENVVFHSKYISYVKCNSKSLLRQAVNEYNGHILNVFSPDEIDSEIHKITVFERNTEAEERYSKIYDGRNIFDFAPLGTNKGQAVKYLCDFKGVQKNDLYVAGDNLNDISMFELTENSYAVHNSKYLLRKTAKHEILSGKAFLSHLLSIV